MPAKLDRCVDDVKADGKSTDSAFAICNSTIKEEVATALGIAGVGDTCPNEVKQEVATALGIAGVGMQESATALGIAGVGMQEHHHPLDTADYEVPDPPLGETVSIPSSASAISIGGKKKLEEIGDNIVKQILETQIGECSCKTKSRPKA